MAPRRSLRIASRCSADSSGTATSYWWTSAALERTLTTSGNLVFVADRQGTLYAVDATVGKMLWQFETGGAVRAGQITYAVNGVQYVAVPSGGDVILTFALPARRR